MKTLVTAIVIFGVTAAMAEEPVSVPTAYLAHSPVTIHVSQSIRLEVDVTRTPGRFGRGMAVWKVDESSGGSITPTLKIPQHGVATRECDNWYQVCAEYTAPPNPGRYHVIVYVDQFPEIQADIEIEVKP